MFGNVVIDYREAEHMRALNRIDRTPVSADITDTDPSGERHGLTARLRNRGTTVAAMVRVSLFDADTGQRVLPTLYCDNCETRGASSGAGA